MMITTSEGKAEDSIPSMMMAFHFAFNYDDAGEIIINIMDQQIVLRINDDGGCLLSVSCSFH